MTPNIQSPYCIIDCGNLKYQVAIASTRDSASPERITDKLYWTTAVSLAQALNSGQDTPYVRFWLLPTYKEMEIVVSTSYARVEKIPDTIYWKITVVHDGEEEIQLHHGYASTAVKILEDLNCQGYAIRPQEAVVELYEQRERILDMAFGKRRNRV